MVFPSPVEFILGQKAYQLGTRKQFIFFTVYAFYILKQNIFLKDSFLEKFFIEHSGMYKRFLHTMSYTVKKIGGFLVPQSGCQSLPKLLNYSWIRECLSFQLGDGKPSIFFTVYKLYLSFKMPLFRIILKFERHIVVILCTNLCYFKLYCTICSV